jgi:hypothetical protein
MEDRLAVLTVINIKEAFAGSLRSEWKASSIVSASAAD